ncbi:hypothetical protein BDW75DRAFT_205772 [Aspergillus navahoensis]
MPQILISCGRTGSQGSVRCRFEQGHSPFSDWSRDNEGVGLWEGDWPVLAPD